MLKPLNIECPACGAKASEPCMTLTDKTMGESHTKRKLAALKKEYPSEVANRVAVQMSNEGYNPPAEAEELKPV